MRKTFTHISTARSGLTKLKLKQCSGSGRALGLVVSVRSVGQTSRNGRQYNIEDDGDFRCNRYTRFSTLRDLSTFLVINYIFLFVVFFMFIVSIIS